MDFMQIKYFLEVAESQHVTNSAKKLHIAQPALTKSIKQLEAELGVPLFEKKGRNIHLTEFGKSLKERLDKILPEIDEIPKEMEKLKGQESKTIKLNILAATNFVISTIVQFQKKHHDCVIDFVQNELKSDCDIGIYTNGVSRLKSNSVLKRCVKEERIYLAVPANSEYAKLDSVDLTEVRHEKFVMLSGSRAFRTICDKLCTIAGFLPNILFESDSPSAVHNIISTGSGIAFWPEYSWGTLKNKNVKLLPIKNPECQRELIIELNKKDVQSKYAEEFYDFLTEKI